MTKQTSCGVLIFSPAGELLLCHANGSRWWDIPKGGGEEGESNSQTAAREAFEECGLRLDPGELQFVGRSAYRRVKDLLLHAVLVERFETRWCVCSSRYVDRWGRLRPEMDRFRWTPLAEVPQHCAKSLTSVLTRELSLPALLWQLLAEGQVVKAVLPNASAPG